MRVGDRDVVRAAEVLRPQDLAQRPQVHDPQPGGQPIPGEEHVERPEEADVQARQERALVHRPQDDPQREANHDRQEQHNPQQAHLDPRLGGNHRGPDEGDEREHLQGAPLELHQPGVVSDRPCQEHVDAPPHG